MTPDTVVAPVASRVILASAGSGKTYELSSRFLRLVASGVDPTRILASTFARAAAAEIRARILQRAAAAVVDPAAQRELAVAIGHPLDQDGATALLERLVGAWGELQISTIDSVMARVVMASALDLGLPPGLALVDPLDEAALRDETLGALLAEDPQRTLSLFAELTAGTNESRVHATIDGVVAAMVGLAHEATDDAWEFLRIPRIGLDEIEPAAARLREIVARSDSDPSAPPRRMIPALRAHLVAIESQEWEQILTKGIGAKIVAGEECFSRDPIPEEIVEAMTVVVAHAAREIIQIVVRRTRASGEVVRRFIRLWRSRLGVDARLTFADLPVLVRELGTDAGALRERIGPLPLHYLLDEMQDTSVAQWEALRPLVNAALAAGGSAFAVGDVKQSIYGWRSGVPEVLESLPTVLGVAAESMTTTHRCRPAVVSAVNALFGAVGLEPERDGDADRRTPLAGSAGASRFRALFQPHVARRDDPSFAWCVMPWRDRLAPLTRPRRLQLVDETVVALATRMSCAAPRASIGVLVRSNAAVARLLARLGPGGAGLDVSARGGTPLGDAPPVEVVLSALRLADHPDDTAAAFHVARSPLGETVGLDGDRWSSARARREASLRWRARLHRDGLARVVGELVRAAAPSAERREQRRLLALAEMALRCDGDLRRFIEIASAQAVADESSSPIRIMTVHQSKGLDFDLVILPDLDPALVRLSGLLAAERRRPQDHRIDAIIRWVRASQRPALPPAALEVFATHRARLEFEALCVLYVAMTRARHGLVSIIPPSLKADPGDSAAALLECHLRAGREGPDPSAWPILPAAPAAVARAASASDMAGGAQGRVDDLRLGTLHAEHNHGPSGSSSDPAGRMDEVLSWLAARDAKLPAADSSADEMDDATLPTTVRSSGRPPRVAARPPSASRLGSLADPFRVDLAARRAATDAGTAWHALLQRIEWVDDLTQQPAAGQGDPLVAAVLAALPGGVANRGANDSAQWAVDLVARARAALGRSALRRLLTGPTTDMTIEVRREWPFVRRTPEGTQRGTIDRLVLWRNAAGAVVEAEIIDYKTGEVTGTDEQLLDRHRDQLAAYASVVAAHFGLATTAIRATLAFVECDRLVSATLHRSEPSGNGAQ